MTSWRHSGPGSDESRSFDIGSSPSASRSTRQRYPVSAPSRMLFRHEILQGIAEGRVTLAFRRWRRAPPADGSSLRSPVGVLRLERVTVVNERDITAADVRRTGMSPEDL